jgi:hypothetical protein
MIEAGERTVSGEIPVIDWKAIMAGDTLFTNLPLLLHDLRAALKFMSKGRFMERLMRKFMNTELKWFSQ